MKLQECLTPSFRQLREELGLKEPSRVSIIELCRAGDSDDCLEIVARSILNEEQMHRAAERYCLGKSRSGKTIYWMINERGTCLDGHIGDSWVSEMLKTREPILLKNSLTTHCLFGLHLICHTDSTFNISHTDGTDNAFNISHTDTTEITEKNYEHEFFELNEYSRAKSNNGVSVKNKTICIVERERTALIMSEMYPQYLWMATVCPTNFTIDMFAPLRGRSVILFPHTDFTMTNYIAWLETADQARRLYSLDISVSDVLERNANEEQKKREIDIADFLFDSS